LEGKLISFLSDVFERCYGLNGRLAELAAGRGVSEASRGRSPCGQCGS